MAPLVRSLGCLGVQLTALPCTRIASAGCAACILQQSATVQGFSEMAALLKSYGGVASVGQNKHADFSAAGSVPNAALGLSARSERLSAAQVAAVQASWGYLTASDFPDKVCWLFAALHSGVCSAVLAERSCFRLLGTWVAAGGTVHALFALRQAESPMLLHQHEDSLAAHSDVK
jgi:hypothetical protein